MSLYQLVWKRYGRESAEEFIARLKSTMKTHGITQADIARASGFQEPHVSRWFTGRVEPSLETKLILDETVDTLIEEAR